MKRFTNTTSTLVLALSLTLGASAKEAIIPSTELVKPLISYVSEADAKDDVKAVYADIKSTWGMVPEPIKGLSLNPKILRNTWESYKISGENKNFSPKLGAMMRMLVAEKNNCKFCVGFNKGMLMGMLKVPEAEIMDLQKDPTTAKLPAKDKAMLLFMLKSTSTPHDVNKADVDGLKKLGWSEKDIMEGVNQATHMVATALFIDTFKIQ